MAGLHVGRITRAGRSYRLVLAAVGEAALPIRRARVGEVREKIDAWLAR